ncbi:unnamed protein product, partial [Mesorhabditis spiculigera]
MPVRTRSMRNPEDELKYFYQKSAAEKEAYWKRGLELAVGISLFPDVNGARINSPQEPPPEPTKYMTQEGKSVMAAVGDFKAWIERMEEERDKRYFRRRFVQLEFVLFIVYYKDKCTNQALLVEKHFSKFEAMRAWLLGKLYVKLDEEEAAREKNPAKPTPVSLECRLPECFCHDIDTENMPEIPSLDMEF